MFKKMKAWLIAWAQRYQQREIRRLQEEGRRLKERIIEAHGGDSVPLSPEERRLLAEKAKGIDPNVLQQISVFDLQGGKPEIPHDTPTESP